MQIVGLAPAQLFGLSSSKISPGVVTVILMGGQVWNPLLGSSARSWKARSGQILPSIDFFPQNSGEKKYSEVLVPSLLSCQMGNASSLLLPFP